MIKWIPNILTSLNLCFGICAIVLLDPLWSTICILISGLCDILDGFSARKLGVSSEIGKELDSFADLITFGFAPVFILQGLIPFPLILNILILATASLCAAFRLARYNTMESSPFFIGLPSPAHGLIIMGLVLTDISSIDLHYSTYAILAIICALLMVSNIRFPSFKSIKPFPSSLYPILIGFLIGLTCLFWQPEFTLFAGMASYIISSIIINLFQNNVS